MNLPLSWIANARRKQGKLDEAIKFSNLYISEFEKLYQSNENSSYSDDLAYGYQNLAEAYMELGKHQIAIEKFRKALSLREVAANS